MLLGDFNAAMDIKLDKTSKKKGGKFPKIFFDLIYQEQLQDIWRLKNIEAKEYTFYLASKKICSSIDLVSANTVLTPLIKRVEILPSIMSDHNPVMCIFRSKAIML